MKIVTIVGARPQFIKASAITHCIQQEFNEKIDEIMIHTGQHFDANMSDIFFKDLEIPKPKYHLNIAGVNHGAMTGRMMEGIEEIIVNEEPEMVLVYGDTNSTLAGALVASKLHIPIAHIEAGLRSFNRCMPEEINRVLTDHVSSLLFCPTDLAVQNLKQEGITDGVYQVGDVMYDVALYFADKAKSQSKILETLALAKKQYILVTCHRAENTNNSMRLEGILQALVEIAKDTKVILPLHPRTHKYIQEFGFEHYLKDLCVLEPLSYLDLVALEQSAAFILTDSGGVQKEAFFYKVPCLTMRDQTEWVETVELGWNRLVGASKEKILFAFENKVLGQLNAAPYGQGNSSQKIIKTMVLNLETIDDFQLSLVDNEAN